MISKKILNALTKEQLIFLINQYQHMEFLISEVCVNESKQHIPSEQAIEEIRKELRNCNLPFCTSTEELIEITRLFLFQNSMSIFSLTMWKQMKISK